MWQIRFRNRLTVIYYFSNHFFIFQTAADIDEFTFLSIADRIGDQIFVHAPELVPVRMHIEMGALHI
ncbi:hypothetical protein D3C76_1715250 [compost metagenome]